MSTHKHKACSVEIKATDEADGLEPGQFTGYASVFGNKDSYGDIVLKGAFADSLAEWRESQKTIPLLWGHRMDDMNMYVGKILEASEDDHGLLVKGQIKLDSPNGTQTYNLIKEDLVSQMSFAYDVVDGGPAKSEEHGDYFELRSLKLYEVSIVPIGANQETELLAVKAAARDIASKAGRVISATNEKSLRSALQSLEDSASQITDVLAAISGPQADDQEKARAAEPSHSGEEPMGAKSDVTVSAPPARRLAAEATIYALKGAEGGSV